MSSEDHDAFVEQTLSAYRQDESPDESLVLADYFSERGDLRHAASALDRAYGLNPFDQGVVERRQSVLDKLAVIENGILFRYVPAGTFLMGSETGDHDEKPIHPVRLSEFWVSETTVTWATYCDVCKTKMPPEYGSPDGLVGYSERLTHSVSWGWMEQELEEKEPARFEREVIQAQLPYQCTIVAKKFPKRELRFDTRPMVAVTEKQIKQFCMLGSSKEINYNLPTEQQWERAARGGKIQQNYPWGDAPPNKFNCDFDNFDAAEIQASKSLPPNGYGLYAMSGGVWEWTQSRYDSQSYESKSPGGRKKRGDQLFRGGSWADCAEAVTVSFRNSATTQDNTGQSRSPTFGFRVFRTLK
ncbi:MAG: formylglycine-generating enzyme family protein [Mariniblastus sp.]